MCFSNHCKRLRWNKDSINGTFVVSLVKHGIQVCRCGISYVLGDIYFLEFEPSILRALKNDKGITC